MMRDNDYNGPFTVWINYGLGWHPYSFDTLKEALLWDRYGNSEFTITRSVQYEVHETRPDKFGGY